MLCVSDKITCLAIGHFHFFALIFIFKMGNSRTVCKDFDGSFFTLMGPWHVTPSILITVCIDTTVRTLIYNVLVSLSNFQFCGHWKRAHDYCIACILAKLLCVQNFN